MAVVVTPQIEIDKYFESEALSQSVLKTLLGGLDTFLSNQEEEQELYYKEKGHFVIGSAVDCILTGQEGEFDKQYYVSQIEKKPSETEMSIIKMTFDDVVDNYAEKNDWIDKQFNDFPNSIQAAIEEHNWQPNWKMETKINKIIDVGTEYFEDLKLAFGKQILSESQNVLIDEIVSSLRTNERTAKYFDRNQLLLATEVDVYYQLPIYFKYRGLQCKALMDLLIVIKVDGKPVTIQGFDLKTMNGKTINFLTNLKSFRYDIQAAWYTEALLNENSSFAVNSGYDLKDVLVKPFTFIVESNSKPGQPLLYELSDQLLRIGKFGRNSVYINDMGELFNTKTTDLTYQPITVVKEVRGFDSLIDEYLYYQENEWKEEKVVADNNGVLKIGWDGIM